MATTTNAHNQSQISLSNSHPQTSVACEEVPIQYRQQLPMYERSVLWRHNKDSQVVLKRVKREEEEVANLNFKPKITEYPFGQRKDSLRE